MRDAIRCEIDRLTEKYNTSNPLELIDALGIQLIWQKYKRLKGFYYVTGQSRYIVINEDLDEREIMLVAAHELGHDRLHQGLAKIAPLKDFMLYDMASRTEYQANTFAAELLISDDDILECIEDRRDFFQTCNIVGYVPQLVTFKLYSMMQRGYPINLPNQPDSRFLAG